MRGHQILSHGVRSGYRNLAARCEVIEDLGGHQWTVGRVIWRNQNFQIQDQAYNNELREKGVFVVTRSDVDLSKLYKITCNNL